LDFSLKKLYLYLEVSSRLGIGHSLYGLWYKLSLKTGVRFWLLNTFGRSVHLLASEPFFSGDREQDCKSYKSSWKERLVSDADKILAGYFRYFAWDWKELGNEPNWLLNPYAGKSCSSDFKHWTRVSEFDAEVGDIKCVWEVSRFEWVLTLARAYAVTKDRKYLDKLNALLKSWVKSNPANMGPNWRCGQEASLRCFNLLLAHLILDEGLSSSLESFLYAHLERINSNFRYALIQDNNHGTSEAVGLYVIGMFLEHYSKDAEIKLRAGELKKKGECYIEKLASRLIMRDGSFSQHSVNYHRVMLDTFSIAETFQREFNEPEFSELTLGKIRLAINWLNQLVLSDDGRVPNLGANDGAMINFLHGCDYRDFRPSIQLASALFKEYVPFDEGEHDEILFWLNLKSNFKEVKKVDSNFIEGGYLVRHVGDVSFLFRLPVYKFRPSQADAMHLDLWVKGENVLTDGGSYSYNDQSGIADLLKSVKGHNVIVFDNADPMPKISRFLYGLWLKGVSKVEDKSVLAQYSDYRGNFHRREIRLEEDRIIVADQIRGSFTSAKMYWHLGLSKFQDNIKVSGDAVKSISMISCERSLYYNQSEKCEAMEVDLGAGIVVTEILL
jgi:hypothetical protein